MIRCSVFIKVLITCEDFSMQRVPCNVLDNDLGLLCDGCHHWCHVPVCAQISVERYRGLLDLSFNWMCPICMPVHQNAASLPNSPSSLSSWYSDSSPTLPYDNLLAHSVSDSVTLPYNNNNSASHSTLPYGDDASTITIPFNLSSNNSSDSATSSLAIHHGLLPAPIRFSTPVPSLNSSDIANLSVTHNPEHHTGPSMSLCLLNIRSLKTVNRHKNKLLSFQEFVYNGDFSIVFLCETWLTPDIHNNEILPCGYDIHRKDRPNGPHGGVLAAVKATSASSSRLFEAEPDNQEIIVVEVRKHNAEKLICVLCYNPPRPAPAQHEFIRQLRSTLDYCSLRCSHILLLGDFNFRNIDWNHSTYPGHNSPEAHFVEVTTSHTLTQIQLEASHCLGGVLDLIFTSQPDKILGCHVVPNGFDSDHFPVIVNFNLYAPKPPLVNSSFLNYKRADLDGLRRFFTDHLNPDAFTALAGDRFLEVSYLVELWTYLINIAVKLFVPTATRKDINQPRWLDGSVRHISNMTRSAYRRAKRTNNPAHLRRHHQLNNYLKKVTRDKYKLHLDSLCDTFNSHPKKFWSFSHARVKSKRLPNAMKHPSQEDTYITDTTEFASHFNTHFQNSFSTSTPQSFRPSTPELITTSILSSSLQTSSATF